MHRGPPIKEVMAQGSVNSGEVGRCIYHFNKGQRSDKTKERKGLELVAVMTCRKITVGEGN